MKHLLQIAAEVQQNSVAAGALPIGNIAGVSELYSGHSSIDPVEVFGVAAHQKGTIGDLENVVKCFLTGAARVGNEVVLRENCTDIEYEENDKRNFVRKGVHMLLNPIKQGCKSPIFIQIFRLFSNGLRVSQTLLQR